MTTLAVTGAGGFIGSHLCEAAKAAGLQVRALPRSALHDPDLARDLGGATAVIHLAARVHGPGRQETGEGGYQGDNVDLTERLAEACVAAGVQRFVFMSSAGVLGRSSTLQGLSDASTPAPYDAYTRSKLAAEQLLRERFAHRLQVAVIRPPVVYGPGAKGSFATLARLAETPLTLPLAGLTAPRSVISVRNLCDLALLATRDPRAAGLCMLAADAEVTSVAGLLAGLRTAQGQPARLFRVPPGLLEVALNAIGKGAYFPVLAQPFLLRPTVASERLGWHPPHRLRDELRWAVAVPPARSLAA
jgi:nucleoside-diphosphate-sugar epimerase